MAEEDEDELDLKALQAFLADVDDGRRLRQTPAAGAGARGVGTPTPPLPPGFEQGPNTGASTSAAAGNGAAAAAEGGKQQLAVGGLVGESTGKVTVEHDDPTAPYLAATSWDELSLSKDILDGIFEMGFVRPSKIQEWALPIAIKGGNIIGQAQNGSGKTAAFALAMLTRCEQDKLYPQAVCVCPTRELAMQNGDVIAKLGKFTKFSVFLAIPQTDRPPRKVESQLIVGTPGKLGDLMKKRTIDARWATIFVVDEADTMIDEDNQMGPQVLAVRAQLPEEVQVLLFSATWPDRVVQFARSMVPRANTIRVQKEDLTLATITQTYVSVERDRWKKASALSELYGALNVGQSIIFVNTRTMAFELAKMMKSEGHTISLICGTQKTGPEQIDISYRDQIMGEFRSGVTKVLIATDVLARGIDVPAVTLVVNFDLPQAYGRRGEVDFETYMHRIGRTGRFGLRGIAVNFVSDEEVDMIRSIQNYYGCSMQKLSGDCEEVEKMLKGLR